MLFVMNNQNGDKREKLSLKGSIFLQVLLHIVNGIIWILLFYIIVRYTNPALMYIIILAIGSLLFSVIFHISIINFFHSKYYGQSFFKKIIKNTIEKITSIFKYEKKQKNENSQKSFNDKLIQSEQILKLNERISNAELTIESLKTKINQDVKNSKSRTRQQRISSCNRILDDLKKIYTEIYSDAKNIFFRHSKFRTAKFLLNFIMAVIAILLMAWLIYLCATAPKNLNNKFVETIFSPGAALLVVFFEYLSLKIVPLNYNDILSQKKYEKAQNNCAQLKTRLEAIPTTSISEADFNYKMEKFSSVASLLLSEIKNSD